MKKGYFIVVLFSLGVAMLQSLKYRVYIKWDLGAATLNNLIIQIIIMFFILLIPGLLLVRWYYKQKGK